mmetsp:Transcript_27775/g.89135  ORF Transcript_27775/g.89135 Transcript_27775/m.89135 type:complete len:402 (-) Transcript_27775:280-1485(-)
MPPPTLANQRCTGACGSVASAPLVAARRARGAPRRLKVLRHVAPVEVVDLALFGRGGGGGALVRVALEAGGDLLPVIDAQLARLPRTVLDQVRPLGRVVDHGQKVDARREQPHRRRHADERVVDLRLGDVAAGDGGAPLHALEHRLPRRHHVYDRDRVVRVLPTQPCKLGLVPLPVAEGAVDPDVAPLAQRRLLRDLEHVAALPPRVQPRRERVAHQVAFPLWQPRLEGIRVEHLHALQRDDAALDQVLKGAALARPHRARREDDPRPRPAASHPAQRAANQPVLQPLPGDRVGAVIGHVEAVADGLISPHVGRGRVLIRLHRVSRVVVRGSRRRRWCGRRSRRSRLGAASHPRGDRGGGCSRAGGAAARGGARRARERQRGRAARRGPRSRLQPPHRAVE